MRQSFLFLAFSLLAFPSIIHASPFSKRDADLFSVGTQPHKDLSGRHANPKDKYFHESVFHEHYDARFAEKQIDYPERRAVISNLVQTYLATLAELGVETWLMHGTLLGWWWNKKALPWDSDSDFQVSEPSIYFLAAYYNMSVFHYATPTIPAVRKYMLEINPHYVDREQTDQFNVIDARWIDMESGLFIDITTARYNLSHPAGKGMLSCKDGHEYRDKFVFPLRDTTFEGQPAKVPFGYKAILQAEYKEKALTQTEFAGYYFDKSKMDWIPLPESSVTSNQMQLAEA